MAVEADHALAKAQAPEGWNRLYVGDVARFQSGAGIAVSGLGSESTDSQIPVFGGNGIAGFTKNALTQEPTVVVGRVGQQCGQVHLTTGPSWITDNALYPRSIRRPVYLPFLASALAALGLNGLKNKNDLPLLTQTILHGAEIALPISTDEQRAIAEALSDADALIESLSQLLAKKRQIKQCAMQELLTGKKRLPGFQGRWIECPFNSIAALRRERISPHRMATPPWCIELEHINSGSGRLESQGFESVQAATKTVFVKGDVLFGKLRAYLRKYWLAEFDGVCSTEIWALRATGILQSNGYLFYTFQRDDLIEAASSAYGTHMPRSDWNVVGAFLLHVPEDAAEQHAIAEILSDMDAAIAAIDARLAKGRDIKQAMMQELLTGRIRLVQPGSNVIPLPLKSAASGPPSSHSAHNWQINEAVVIGVLAQRFGNEKFPLPRKRRVKLTYLLHRHAEGRAEGYLKKAAGPYDPNTKYKGPEAIALKNGYVRAVHNGTYEGFVTGDKADQAQRYFEQWYDTTMLDWLERFHYRKTEELELLATVDMAMVDLAAASQSVDVAGVKRVIAAHPEWLPKLSRELFSDEGIRRAIAECTALFPA